MDMNWICKKHPSGRRYWVLEGTEYTIETTGYHTLSAKTGAERSRRIGGGYAPSRGRQRLGLYSTLPQAKDRAERDCEARA